MRLDRIVPHHRLRSIDDIRTEEVKDLGEDVRRPRPILWSNQKLSEQYACVARGQH